MNLYSFANAVRRGWSGFRPSLLLLCLLVFGCRSRVPVVEPGVPLGLAVERSARLSDVIYDLSLDIPEDRTRPIEGRLELRFALSDPDAPLMLDFVADSGQVHQLSINGTHARADIRNEHLTLPSNRLQAGVNDVSIDFVAGERHLNRREDLVYTLFVPERARFLFPCFDQPDLKAAYVLSLTVPTNWRALTNAGEVGREVNGEKTTLVFAETAPLSTYHFAFLAGELQVEQAERDGRKIRIYHREPDEEKMERSIGTLFDLHFNALAWMEEYTGIAFPYPKFDVALIPAFQFSGMEHPGAIYYRDTSLLLTESPSQTQLMSRASLIAHETAHMWFGDLVTMRWFDDVWTKEVFANFMAAKMVQPSFPDVDHDLNFYLRHYPSAYAVDRTAGTHPIRQKLDNLDDAASLYGAIIYQKAPIVMAHLEKAIGAEAMREGLQTYLSTYSYSNASWNDLITLLDLYYGGSPAEWSNIWVDQAGRPAIRVARRLSDDGVFTGFRLIQEDPADRGRIWRQPTSVLLGYPGDVRSTDIAIDEISTVIYVESGFPPPAYILPGSAGKAYGYLAPDDSSLVVLADSIWTLPTDIQRAVAWQTLKDNMLEDRITPEALMHAGLSLIRSDTSELLIDHVLDGLSDTYWRFLPASTRMAMADTMEVSIWNLLMNADTSTLRRSAFAAYRRIALSEEGTAVLRDLWSEELQIDGLVLSPRDFEQLSFALAVRSVADADSILDVQFERLTDPERINRFVFIRPALSPDPAVRDSAFRVLLEVENRQREPWALSAMSWLNHPLRTPHAERYLPDGLEVLEEVKTTGTIFFPKRWLDALFGGHSSTAAVEMIETYLDDHPDLPKRLRQKVEQSADMVRRAAHRKQGVIE